MVGEVRSQEGVGVHARDFKAELVSLTADPRRGVLAPFEEQKCDRVAVVELVSIRTNWPLSNPVSGVPQAPGGGVLDAKRDAGRQTDGITLLPSSRRRLGPSWAVFWRSRSSAIGEISTARYIVMRQS